MATAGAVEGVFNSVSCFSPTSCEAVGYYYNGSDTQVTLAEAWNGTKWTLQSTPNPAGGSDNELSSVSCGSDSTCLAVGGYYNGSGEAPLSESWNGTNWAIQSVPMPTGAIGGDVGSVSCPTADQCMAVGDFANASNVNMPLAESWNGSAFTAETPKPPTGAGISGLGAVACSASPSVDCEATGGYLPPTGFEIETLFAERWNGTTWSPQNAPTPLNAQGGAYPTGLSCASPTACTSVGEADNSSGNLAAGWAQVWNGKRWANKRMPTPKGAINKSSVPMGVSCSAAPSTDCMVVGWYSNGSTSLNLAEAWNGIKWTLEKPPAPKGSTASALDGVSCSSPPGSCTAVGDDTVSSGVPVTLAEGWNGTKWSVQTTPVP